MNTTLNARRSPLLVRSVAAVLCGVAVAAITPVSHAQQSSEVTRRVAETQVLSSQLYASPSQVRLVQEALREKGLDPGRVDGVWGEQTAQAVSRFQKQNQLESTGKLDTRLLAALDIGDVLEGETSESFLDGLLSAEQSARKTASGKGAPLYVSPLHVAQIQHMLQKQAFYRGNIDGVWGESTARAANQYRQSMGLEAEQGIDIALLRALNRESTDLPDLSQTLAANASPQPLLAGPVTLRALQRALNAKGHDAGRIDGEWGENTRAAVRDFQRERELEPTGTLTLPTLAALGVDIRSSRQAAADPDADRQVPTDRKED